MEANLESKKEFTTILTPIVDFSKMENKSFSKKFLTNSPSNKLLFVVWRLTIVLEALPWMLKNMDLM